MLYSRIFSWYQKYKEHKEQKKKAEQELREKVQQKERTLNELLNKLALELRKREQEKKACRILSKTLIEYFDIEFLGKTRISGRIDYRFRVGQKMYVYSTPDAGSNYLYVPNNNTRDIRNTFERELALAAWEKIRKRYSR